VVVCMQKQNSDAVSDQDNVVVRSGLLLPWLRWAQIVLLHTNEAITL